MSLRIRTLGGEGASTLGALVERIRDGLYYDFSIGRFVAKPAIPLIPLAEWTPYKGQGLAIYGVTLATGFDVWTDGWYYYTIHQAPFITMNPLALGMAQDSGWFLMVGGTDQYPWWSPPKV